jgi:hypothetical protein
VTARKGVGLVASKHLVQRAQGFAVAEFAIVLPAVVFVAAMALVVFSIATTQIQLESAAAHAARIVGRGDALPDSYRNALPENTSVIVTSLGDTIEVTLRTDYTLGPIWLDRDIELEASARARLELAIEDFG